MNLFFDTLAFIIIAVLAFYIPGRVASYLLGIREKGITEKVISTALGISIFLLTSYALAWLNIPQLQYGVILLFAIIYFIKRKKLLNTSFSGLDRVTWVIIGMGTLVSLLKTATSGILTEHGWRYVNVNAADGLVHIARVKNFLHHFPPQHPALSGVEFRGYHYFYDFLLSTFSQLFGFTAEDLYFRFFSFLIVILFGTSFAVFTQKVFKNKFITILATFFAFFSVGFGVILKFVDSRYSSMVVNPIELITDPSIYLSLAIFLIALLILPKINSFRHAIAVGLLLGVLAQIKVYIGLLAIICLVSLTVFRFAKNRKIDKNFILCNIVTAVLTVITYFPNNFGVGSLVFIPFLFYSHYIQQAFFDGMHWEVKRQIFAADNNYLRIIILYIQAISIFWIAALGPRLLIIGSIKRIFTKEFWKNEYNFMILVICIFMVLLPTFFIQTISVFDIGQFFWILTVFLSIPLSITLFKILSWNRVIGIGAITLVVVYSLFSQVVMSLNDVFPKREYIVSKEDTQVLSDLEEYVGENETIVVIPKYQEGHPVHHGLSLVSAISGRSTYFEDEIIHYPLDEIYAEREKNIKDAYMNMTDCDVKGIGKAIEKIGTKNVVSFTEFECLGRSELVQLKISGDQMTFYKFR